MNKATDAGGTPLLVACEMGKVDVVQVLLDDPRVEVNKPTKIGETPLYLACGGGYDVVQVLLNDLRVEVNKSTEIGATPLYIACQIGKVDVVQVLLNDPRVEIEQATNEGATPLEIAWRNRHNEIARYLKKIRKWPPLNDMSTEAILTSLFSRNGAPQGDRAG